MYKNVLLIPALNPDDSFIEYVRELRAVGFERIVAVDDGSREELKYIFTTLRDEYGCELITHEVNMGKGRALKDGFLYINEKYGELMHKAAVKADIPLRKCFVTTMDITPISTDTPKLMGIIFLAISSLG